jgi:DNA-binding FrmR family transcriptional regulator
MLHDKALLSRLNRSIGQITGVKKMLEEGRYCVDILNQSKAIRASLKSLEKQILENHIRHCITESFDKKENREEKIKELLDIYNRF